jgi:hypothetical protein
MLNFADLKEKNQARKVSLIPLMMWSYHPLQRKILKKDFSIKDQIKI